jgi:hypothetical protein
MVVPFGPKSGEAFIEAYFSGCFRVLSHLQINQFNFEHFQAIKICNFFISSPTLEVNLRYNTNLGSSFG